MKKTFSLLLIIFLILLSTSCNSKNSKEDTSKISPSTSSEQTQSDTNKKSNTQKGSLKTAEEKNTSNTTDSKTTDTNLKLGDNNERVRELQKKLNKFNYNLTTDGEFGTSTDFAVKNFQSKLKIPSDGIVGPQTLKLLDSTPAKAPYLYKPSEKQSESNRLQDSNNSYESFINSKDCSSNTDYYIYTNLSKHVVCIFKGSNHNWNLVQSFSCSVGKSSTPTIHGHFSVGTKGTYFVTDNGLICKYFTQISGNYLFHSILYDQNGNVVDSRLGANISHGCIRLALENAKYIYDTVPASTAIWIQ